MENKRAEKVSVEQKELLVEFMIDHMDFARNKLLGPEGKITSGNLWQILCQQLNSAGPEKNLAQWQRVWKDIKMKVKKKASALAGARTKTGGGPPEDVGLTDLEEKIVTIISKIAVFGLTGPDGVPLDSADPMPSEEASVINPEPGPSVSKLWVNLAETAEVSTQEEEMHVEESELFSPATTRTDSSDGETSATPLRKRKRMAESALAADSFIDLGKETIKAIGEVKAELINLTKQVTVVSQQNERIMSQRDVTNNILLRIATALEGQYANE